MVTAERLRGLLHYDPDTGVFVWRVGRRGGTATAGSVAGSVRNDGYRAIKIDGKRYKAHRLAWLYMTGAFPEEDIDHRNLSKDDNRWKNLRAASRGENCRNIRMRRHNTSGAKGVSWKVSNQKWSAQIRVNGRLIHLGLFTDINEAAAAYAAASAKYHGEFGRAA